MGVKYGGGEAWFLEKAEVAYIGNIGSLTPSNATPDEFCGAFEGVEFVFADEEKRRCVDMLEVGGRLGMGTKPGKPVRAEFPPRVSADKLPQRVP
jgi:hypothetical protein